MKFFFVLFLVVFLLPSISSGQSNNSALYNENNFVKQGQGLDATSANELYAVWYKHSQDSSLCLKKTFVDSSYSQIIAKSFYREGALMGPYYGYLNGNLIYQSNYKYGRLDGEVLSYNDGKITLRAHYLDGVKSGIWEEFDSEGKLIHRITYDAKGHVVNDEKIASN